MSDQPDRSERCGICQEPAEVLATVPMCGKRPRYPLCNDCLNDISDYAENVTVLT